MCVSQFFIFLYDLLLFHLCIITNSFSLDVFTAAFPILFVMGGQIIFSFYILNQASAM